MKHLAAAAILAATATAALGQPTNAGDRHETVAGWALEDIANPQDFDSGARALKMSREAGHYSVFLTFDLDSRSPAPVNGYGVDLQLENQSDCSIGGGSESLDAAVLQGGARVRAFLAGENAEMARQCATPDAGGAEALAGFEEAYARLAAWRDQRQGERRPAAAASR